MSEPPPNLVVQLEKKIDEIGKRRALEWLKTKVSDGGVLGAAKLWADNADQAWADSAKGAFRGAVDALLGKPPAAEPREKNAGETVTRLLKALLSGQTLPASLKKAMLRDYLRALKRSVERVNSLGIKADVTDGQAPRLEKVYVERRARIGEIAKAFDPSDPGKRLGQETETGLLEALTTRPRAVITAGPGIGKTFLFRHLCLHLTDPDLGKEAPGFEPSVPVLVSLRKFAPWLRRWRADSGKTNDQPIDLKALWEFLDEEWRDEFPELATGIREWMDADPVAPLQVTFLFDGLDEVPIERSDRVWVSEMLMELESRYPKLAIYVTCRVKSYGDRPWWIFTKDEDPPGWGISDPRSWPVIEIQAFSPDEIEQFIRGWYEELHRSGWFAGDRARELAALFSDALGKREELQKLAPSPLMLTQMCVIHGSERGELPDGRGALYKRLIGLLIGEWEKERLEAARGGEDRFAKLCQRKTEISGGKALTTDDFQRKLGELVFRLTEEFAGSNQKKRKSTDAAGDAEGSGILIPESDLEAVLFDLCLGGKDESEIPEDLLNEARVWRAEMLGFIKEHGGLLDREKGTGSAFAFPHRQYGEFLAGWFLVYHHPDKFGRLAALCDSFEAWNDVWREPVLFGISWLASQDGGNTVSRIVLELTGRDPDQAESLKLHVAGEILAEYGDPDYFRGSFDIWKTVGESLEKRMLAAADTVPERIRFGLSLGQMGDLRDGVGLDPQTGLPKFAWSDELMPPKKGFIMGSEESDDQADSDEKPQFVCRAITVPFRMAIHPVTVAQYLAFVKAGGYRPEHEPTWWTDAGRKWKAENRISGPDFLTGGVTRNAGNQPVTGVSFYEAVAFCRWLREAGKDDKELRLVRLPNEMEWEFAARGAKGRRYPWGDEATDLTSRCHFSETGIDHPSAVGLFGNEGQAVGSKIEDLSGNVWEWTGSEWEENLKNYSGKWGEEGDHRRALRGGSFVNGTWYVRAAIRYGDLPGDRDGGGGFRVVSSPFEGPET